MENKKSNLAGFIYGMQAGNIASNRMKLEVYINHILSFLKEEKKMLSIIQTINRILDILKVDSPDLDIVDWVIKLGEELMLAMSSNNIDIESQKECALAYLKIAKILEDTRVNNLAISMAKYIIK